MYVHTYIRTCTSVNVCSKMAATSDLSLSFLNSVFIPYKYFEIAAHNDNIPFSSLLVTYFLIWSYSCTLGTG